MKLGKNKRQKLTASVPEHIVYEDPGRRLKRITRAKTKFTT